MTAFIEQLLYQRIGMDVHSIGRKTFERVLSQQLQKHHCSADEYALLLLQSPEIWTALVEAIVIPETWFFRYPESFRLFEELVKPQMMAMPGRQPLKILCLPCSTGEEAYSIAMTLFACGFNNTQFCIDALDINNKVLEQARQGFFRSYSFRGQSQTLFSRYFQVNEGGYQLHPDVVSSVNFRYGNLFDVSTLPAKNYDFVFCRNLLIYFDNKNQQVAISQLQKLLSHDGYLFSGPAEAGAFVRSGMSPLGRRDSFAFRHMPQKQSLKVASTLPAPSVPKNKTSPLKRKKTALALSNSENKTVKSARVQLTPVNDGTGQLSRIEQLANAGQLATALKLCEQLLQELGPSAQLFYLWGLVSDGMEQQRNAELYYRKALYLEPMHAAALRQLAALLHAQGQTGAAALIEQRMKFERV